MGLRFPPGWTRDDMPRDHLGRIQTWPKIEGKRAHYSEWCSWAGARQRCHSESAVGWKNYGGRGIFMCREWFMDFDAFFAHIGPRPPGYTLDRIDNDRGYEPGNVRWTDQATQANNRRPRSEWIYGEEPPSMSDNLTPGQRRTARAVAVRMRTADEKMAAKLRDRGWVVIPPEAAAAAATNYRTAASPAPSAS